MSRKGRLGRRPFLLPALTDFSSTPSTQRETGDRIITSGHDAFSGPGSLPPGLWFGCPAPGTGSGLFGCLLPLHFCTRPRRICTFALYTPYPHPLPGAATCHPKMLPSLLHLCTGRRPICTFALTWSSPRALRPLCPRACLPCPHANLSTGQLSASGQPANWSTDQLASRPTFALLHRPQADLHLCNMY